MATNTFIEIDLREADALAGLTGIRYDLHSARCFAQMLKGEYEATQRNGDLVDALTSAILVRYSRPFVTGVRARLTDEALNVLSDPQRQKHDRLRAYRDKHVAHSVNEFEENQPVARYWVERVQEEGITSVECIHTRVVGLSLDDIEDVIELATEMIAYVDECLAREKTMVLEAVRAMPVEEVLGKAIKEPAAPDLGKIDRSRGRP